MSFGFSFGDFVTVSELAWRLYRDCYKIARGAPQEFQLLVAEISTLSNSLSILQEEAKDPDSALVRAGEDRVRMVNEMVKNIVNTLRSLEKVAKKYEILGSNSKRKLIWAKFKWSVEFTSIDGLRNKLVYHNTVMNLLLTSVGNSSLQRIENSTDALESDVREIKSYITGQQNTEIPLIPSISSLGNDSEALTLSASLMQHAEVIQPWSTIGVDQWIESGRWWLLRSQMELHAVTDNGQEVPLAPYTSLIKASWILIDIISCHPQVPFLSASTHSEVQILSAELKSEFQRLKNMEAVVPDLRDLETQDLRIWESQSKGPQLRPQKGGRGGSKTSVDEDQWRVEGGEEVLFQRFALLKMQVLPNPIPCIILLLANEATNEIRVWAQSQNGSGVMAMSFETKVKLVEPDGCDMRINNEQLTFPSPDDVQMLCSLIEGANFYYHGTMDLGSSMSNLKAIALLCAVKAQRRETAIRLLDKLPTADERYANLAEGENLLAVAKKLADEHSKGTLNEELCKENRTPRSQLPLFQWAIECNHIDLAILIISSREIDNGGDTWRDLHPLGLACLCGHEAIAKALLHDANRKNPNGQWPIHLAASQGYTTLVRLLLRNGADVDPRNPGGLTPLSESARNGHDRTVELLVDRGANIENRSNGKFTPLEEACDRRQEGVISILLDEGANCNAPRNDGMTPYHTALQRGVSKPIFDLIAAKYFTQTMRTATIPETRATLTWTIDSDWASLWLDSPSAYFDHPSPLPPNVKDVHGHMIEVSRPAGVSTKFWIWTYTCKVVYRTPELHFSTGHGSLGTANKRGRTEILLTEEGADKSTWPMIIETGTTGHPSNFRSHKGVKVLKPIDDDEGYVAEK